MKNIIVVCAFALVSASASAIDTNKSVAVGSDHNAKGLGVASVTTGVGNNTLITGWIPLSASVGLQPYFGISQTVGGFNFLAGTAIKVGVAGGSQAGFHLGGDALFGSIASNFTAVFGGLMGFHFTPANSIMLSFDAGPQLTIYSGATNFTIAGASSLLGASIMYMF